jgi:hypothetical protein
MRKATLVLLALGLVVASTAYASNAVRISQIYGASGNYYKCDYVELFNNSGCPVDIGGWSLQYGSATGSSFGSSTYNYALIPSGAVIPACGYYLIRGYCSTAGADLPVTPDLQPAVPPVWSFNLSGSSGKVALFSDQVLNRTCAQAQASPNLVDLVGYGAANCFETTPAVAGDNFSVLVRNSAGAVDTDNNLNDFSKVAQPWPMHTTASPRNPDCIVPVGACCLPPIPTGGCIIVSALQCAQYGGVYIGDWIPCIPDPCPATPTKGTSWGQIKTIYK